MRIVLLALACCMLTLAGHAAVKYPIVGTGQDKCYDNTHAIAPPAAGAAFYGQDAQYGHQQPSYTDNGNGTISDNVTGLQWVKARGDKVPYADAVAGAAACRVGGYRDWRLPTIKELYSLINFTGSYSPEGRPTPYLDTRYFDFVYGDTRRGERAIDCQDWSATSYLGTTMNGNATIFGVNFADGRIKGYPRDRGPRGDVHKLYVRYVRGNPAYGVNELRDNGNGTISDQATDLMWTKRDSGTGMNWQDALAWVQARNAEKYLGYNDWRLPDAKELQSIVDYTRNPAHAPAIAPIFSITKLVTGDYPYFWTGTTHLDGPPHLQGATAVYVAFGRALGWMAFPPDFTRRLLDVHGAGAQRSDPKTGNPANYPQGRGPQGDDIRILNFVRMVRGGLMR